MEENCHSVHTCPDYQGWKSAKKLLVLIESIEGKMSPYNLVRLSTDVTDKIFALKETIIKEYGHDYKWCTCLKCKAKRRAESALNEMKTVRR